MAAYIDEDLNDPEEYFTAFLWTGDGTSPRSITGVGFQANMMWSKIRDTGHEHSLVDTVRGVDNKRLKPDAAAAEDTNNTHGHFDSLDSDGFTLTGASGYWNVNTNTKDYVGWFWKESATSGFDIVSYTGNDTAGREISHSLSAVPKMIIVKDRNGADSWVVYHGSLAVTQYLILNDTNAALSDNEVVFYDTAPTSSVFTVGAHGVVNEASDNYIAYCFAEKQGFSKFGSYDGNGLDSGNGPFVYTGFRPAFFMLKEADNADNWIIMDNKRLGYNKRNDHLFPNLNSAEYATDRIDIVSNGIKIIDSDGAINTSGSTYVYAAFAESPFVNSNGVPNNAR